MDNRGPQVEGIAWAFVVISTIATALRVYCRGVLLKSFLLDDYLAVIGWALFIVYSSYSIAGVHYGTGLHVRDIITKFGADSVPKAMQMWWTCEPTYVLANMFIKASIAIFLLRLFVHPVHRAIVWFVFVLTEVYGAFFFLLFVLQCRPTSLFWERITDNPPEGKCIDARIVSDCFYGYSAISCLTDWTFSLLPILLVWGLQMSFRVKVSVVCILAAGAIASSATIVRFPFLYTLTDINDFLYSTSDVAIWSTVETGIGITSAAAATLRPLMRSVFGGGSSGGGATSARQWHRTGSQAQKYGPGGGGGAGGSRGDDAFAMHSRSAARGMGVTTVIDHGKDGDDDGATTTSDLEAQHQRQHQHQQRGGHRGPAAHHRHNKDDLASDLSSDDDGWNSSQTHLPRHAAGPPSAVAGPWETPAGRPAQAQAAKSPWQITVNHSIVQTRDTD